MKTFGIPALYNCVPGGVSPLLDVQQAKEVGYKIVITPILALGAVYEAVETAFKDLKESGNTKGNRVAVRDLFESCGLREVVEFDQVWGGNSLRASNGV
jgi:2-methylisocitrate lyase-like PEP mutase family enzyme